MQSLLNSTIYKENMEEQPLYKGFRHQSSKMTAENSFDADLLDNSLLRALFHER